MPVSSLILDLLRRKTSMNRTRTIRQTNLSTVWAARHDFGALNTPVAMGIAVAKALLVILFFMHVKYSSRLVQLVVVCAFVWLAIMIVGILHDYYSPRVTPDKGAVPALSRQ